LKVDKQHTDLDQLKKMLYRHTAEMSQKTIEAGGVVEEYKFKELERLSGLIEKYQLSQPPAPAVRWPIIASLLITLLIVSILLFARVSSTEIELDLSLSEVSFRLPEQQLLANEMNVLSLGVSGINEIQIPRSQTENAKQLNSTEGNGMALQLEPAIVDKQEGSVTLAAIILPAKSQIAIRGEVFEQYRLSIKGVASELSASVNGPVQIGYSTIPKKQVNFSSPRSILFKSNNKQIDIDLIPVPAIKGKFSKQLLVDSLSLFSIEEQIDIEKTIVKRLSSILSGALYFEELGGKKHLLRSGQELRFDYSTGEIRTITLKDGNIDLAFHGNVQGMTTGSNNNQISLMPTYLEWLSARHGLSLLWGTTLYFFGLITSILNWWRARK
jgi:hypothetical protein